jgi:hypothetical protein
MNINGYIKYIEKKGQIFYEVTKEGFAEMLPKKELKELFDNYIEIDDETLETLIRKENKKMAKRSKKTKESIEKASKKKTAKKKQSEKKVAKKNVTKKETTKKTVAKKKKAEKVTSKKKTIKKDAIGKTSKKKTNTKDVATKKGRAPRGAEKQNGVNVPGPGTQSYIVWRAMNKLKSRKKRVPTRQEVVAAVEGENVSNATIGVSMMLWRKYHGVPSNRSSKK